MTWIPTEEQRARVEELVAEGVGIGKVANLMHVSAKTLAKKCQTEIARGGVEAARKDIAVARTLFQMATSGTNVAATIFWLKARAGWSERGETEDKAATGDGVKKERQRRASAAAKGRLAVPRGPKLVIDNKAGDRKA